jgi:hypothetical protein
VQIAITTISSLTEAYGLNDASRNSMLNQDIAEARFVDEDLVKDEDEEDMKVEN